MYVSDKNKLIAYEAEAEGQKVRYLDQLNAYADILRPGVIATSWDGDLTEMTDTRLLWLLGQWAVITEDDALPPASGTSSGTRSPRRASTATP